MDDMVVRGILPIAMLLAAPPLGYAFTYAALRLCGKLRVGREGWHAGCVHVGRRVVLPALGLFTFFQPPLRLESALRRRLAGPGGSAEPAISEVVVEVLPL